jgi:ribose transport system substrate-binding protein
MENSSRLGSILTPRFARLALAALVLVTGVCMVACGSHRRPRIAVIPQTEGTLIWEAAHVGAEAAAHQTGALIYWNAPTREDDIEAQIALVQRVVGSHYQGLVLAPDQALSLISPVRRALARGIPTVVIGSPLAIPAGGDLSYIVNDDEAGGQMAAQRVNSLLHGHGTVALLGINPDVTGIMIRARAFEQALARNSPGISIVERRMGSFNVPREQQVAQDTLKANPELDIIVALTSATIDGTLSALDADPSRHSIRVIGFDVDGYVSFDDAHSLDCVIQEDSRTMGQKAVEWIVAHLAGRSESATLRLPPVLIARDNIHSAEVRRMWSQDWTLGHSPWSPVQ